MTRGNFFICFLSLLGTCFLPLTILVYFWHAIHCHVDSILYKSPAYREPLPTLQTFPSPLNLLLGHHPLAPISHSVNALSSFVLIIMWLDCIVTAMPLPGMIEWNIQCLFTYVTTFQTEFQPVDNSSPLLPPFSYIDYTALCAPHSLQLITSRTFKKWIIPFSFTPSFYFDSLRGFFSASNKFIISKN